MKLAKFVLHCDNHRVRNLEELKEHFDILDVLEHYKANTLQRWLQSRTLQSELEQVLAINATNDADIIFALCQIFGVGVERETIEAVLKSQQALANKQAQLESYQSQQLKLENLIRKLIQEAIQPNMANKGKPKSYQALKSRLLNAPDLESGKAILVELLNHHFEALEKDRKEVLRGLAIKHKKSLWMGTPKHYPALLLYFFASPIFQEDEELDCSGGRYSFSQADFETFLASYQIKPEGDYYTPKPDTMFVCAGDYSLDFARIKLSDGWLNIPPDFYEQYYLGGNERAAYYELPALKA
ncbi:hypothetical protein [Helicobacter bizzozeronii]|uniref:Uncharacterized protein n=1 Tax=Helicobacter bizzozeronii (strain CIII-1) TaxID=1002804 RepID=F8KPT5_HELBC|nr:hypothetical protein [Helicobacter bizzozeronii]CCB80828.1 hypothetical protein HBZC1_18420 [Helicobacter bizzozeronii CIII-1]